MYCVDLGERFHMSIYLQNLASIQPRTSRAKFARSPCPAYHHHLFFTDPSGTFMELACQTKVDAIHGTRLRDVESRTARVEAWLRR